MKDSAVQEPVPVAGDLGSVVARRGSLIQTFKAVAWSFLGIRRSDGYEQDVSRLNPLHVVAAGILAAAVFVIGIWLFVGWIVSSGVAA